MSIFSIKAPVKLSQVHLRAPTYRSDIDGLRALAVIPVVLFHAGVPVFAGGYIGVDVFFVISGYLITQIIASELSRGSFDILDFYRRRIARIFPALLLVISVSTAVAWVVLTPERLVQYGRSLTSVTLFSSNFYFWKSIDYFSTKAHVQPLLHTWSLAVEEQFYIFYPLALGIALRIRALLPLMLLIASGVSLAAACALLYEKPGAVFYLLPFRAWELAIGGLLALGIPRPLKSMRLSTLVAPIGLALIVLPIFLYGSQTPFPGLAAIPPTLGTMLIIWTGAHLKTWVHQGLSSPVFVLIGRASYSLYLWHFPLFAYTTYLRNQPLDLFSGMILSTTALIAALATLRWVEDPIRRLRSVAAMKRLICMMLAVGVVGIVLANSDGFPARLPTAFAQIAEAARDKTRHPFSCMSNGDVIIPPKNSCKLGIEGAEPKTLLWGDSHAMVVATAMQKAAIAGRSAFLFSATADCPPGINFRISPEYEISLSRTPSYMYCEEYNREMLKLALEDLHIENVVIAARWSNWRIGETENLTEAAVDLRLADFAGAASSPADNARIFETGFKRLVEALVSKGKRVFIVGPIPEPQFDVPHALFVAQFGLSSEPQPTTMAAYRRRHERALGILERIAEIPGVQMVWPHAELCHLGSCPITSEGKPLYFDHNHLSVIGAEKTSAAYERIFSQN